MIYWKDGIIEDIFSDDRTEKNLENFIWQTVDPSRVEEVNPFEALAGMAGAFGVISDGEDDYEECDCSEPDCDCEEEDEDYDDDEDYEDYDNEDEEKVQDKSENESEDMLNSEEVSNNKDEL